MVEQATRYPGGSKGAVNRAGDAIRAGNAQPHHYACIDEWRSAHKAVLNTFQSWLRTRTQGKNITVAQRLKRKATIFDKLTREPQMQLSRMDDIAGCRLIFSSIDELYSFRTDFHQARVSHKLRNGIDRYDYIKHPKNDGYRGVHDIYVYGVNSKLNSHLNGSYIEIQYRTRIQHAWSTANEVIGVITENQPKVKKGDQRYSELMGYASEILARAYENTTSCYPAIEDRELVTKFVELDEELNMIQRLKQLNSSDDLLSTGAYRNKILIFDITNQLSVYSFKYATEAVKRLFLIEKENPEKDVVLVRADTNEEVREAFKNYFTDATQFIQLIEEGIALLSQSHRPPMFFTKSVRDSLSL